MRKIIAMIGVPAVGKSTIMRRFLEASPDWKKQELVKLVPTLYNATRDLHVFGSYDPAEPFPGTDRYSMAVQPQAIKFVKETTGDILFEGDRLNTGTFLEFLAEQPDTDFQILVITANSSIIEERHSARADTQSETFLKGRETKIDNVRSSFLLMDYIKTFEHNNSNDTNTIVEYLHQQLPEIQV